MAKPKALYILKPQALESIYGPEERADLERLVDFPHPPQSRESIAANPSILRDVEIVISGWGGPKMDRVFLDAAPRLKAVFYGAGATRGLVSEDFWELGVLLTSAIGMNSLPVAEFAVAQIVLCLKGAWKASMEIRREGRYPEAARAPGAFGSTVGLVSLGNIGRMVAKKLRPYEVNLLAHDPYVDPSVAAALGAELCSLDDLFRRSHVVSLHTPWIPGTVNMIRGRHFGLMPQGGSFLNTARGAVVCEVEMIDALRERPDLFALLDVTFPEPPAPGSPLYTLPNVALTPHLAGSLGNECRRMGRFMVDELRRYLEGSPLLGRVHPPSRGGKGEAA